MYCGVDDMASEVSNPRGQAADEGAIARLWLALSEYHVALDDRMPVPTEGAAERYAARLVERRNDPQTRAFVAEIDREVVGFVLGAVVDLYSDLFEHAESGYIADVFVDPAHRRRGVARQLFGAMAGWFRAGRRAYRVAGRRDQSGAWPFGSGWRQAVVSGCGRLSTARKTEGWQAFGSLRTG